MGDKYAVALGQGLKGLTPRTINVSENRLTARGAKALIENLNTNVEVLDFSHNRIGEKGIQKLCNYLEKNGQT
jgi:hypothetical protein